MRARHLFPGIALATILSTRSAPAAETFGGPNDGFVPPTKNVAKCESTVVDILRRNAACLDRCTFEAGEAAFFRGRPFDDERCEAACGDALVRTANALYGRGICPSCITAISPAPVAMLNEHASNAGTGLIACAGTIPLGGDDGGFLPPDRGTAKCELAVGRSIRNLDQGLLACLMRAGTGAYRGKPFDENRCRSMAERRYDRTTAGLTGCPPCLGDNAMFLRGVVRANSDLARRLVYCASPGGAFLDDPAH